ncbi:MAG: hypothetical protein PHY48_00670 [Candidatus Cloacimonetes bacterium]|nr:hypothetical protein [Candidatus Cloacimonadota bacterium]
MTPDQIRFSRALAQLRICKEAARWGGKLRFAPASSGCYDYSYAVTANSEIGSPIKLSCQ